VSFAVLGALAIGVGQGTLAVRELALAVGDLLRTPDARVRAERLHLDGVLLVQVRGCLVHLGGAVVRHRRPHAELSGPFTPARVVGSHCRGRYSFGAGIATR
jgi:hypothetical protein